MANRKLTIKQKKFADEYIKTGNATQSYINAGYKVSTRPVAEANGRKLLGNHKVKTYIDKKMKELEDAQIAKADEVLKHLTAVMRGEETEDVPILIGDGEQKLVPKGASLKDRIRAAELLGRRYALFTDNIDATVDQVVFIDNISDDND